MLSKAFKSQSKILAPLVSAVGRRFADAALILRLLTVYRCIEKRIRFEPGNPV